MADKLISQVITDNPELFAGLPIPTSVQTALNAKQATLVSGTNVKTINGVSLVGSGDLSVGSGSADDPKVVASAAGAVNIASGTVTVPNTFIDPTTLSCALFGGATSGYVRSGANAIGINIPANVIPIGTSGSANNAADTYIAGTADYSQVFGYDNIANGVMSVIFGSHSLIYTAATHSIIIGSVSSIQGASDGSVVLGNNNSIMGASYSAIIGGNQNLIQTSNNYNAILSGVGHQMYGTTGFSLILGGSDIVLNNADRCLAFGEGITVASGMVHCYSFGKNLSVLNRFGPTFGGAAQVSGGSQRSITDNHIYTTDATPTFSYGFATEAGQCIAGNIRVMCRNVTDNKLSTWLIPVAIKNIAGVVVGSTAANANVVRAIDTFAEDAFGVEPFIDFTIGTGTIYVKFQGIASKSMHWRIEHDLSIVK